MTLYDLVICGMANQIYHVYICNIYDQNIFIGRGYRRDIMSEDITDCFEYLINKIDHWSVAKDGSLVVRIRDENFENRAEQQYSPEYVAKWDVHDPKTRPWRFSSELEDNTK